MKKIVYTSLTILLAASCELNFIPSTEEEADQTPVVSETETDYNTGFVVPETVPVLTESELGVGGALNAFGYDVFSQILKRDPEDSYVFSPLSLSLALSMSLSGAEGETGEQLAALLGLEGMDKADVASYFKKMLGRMLTLNKKVSFQAANALWYDTGFSIKEGYLASLGTNYDASAFNVDFENGQKLVDAINKWVSEKTSGTIKEIVKDRPSKPLVLANALYFSATWTFPFFKVEEKGTFYGAKGSVDVDYCDILADYQYLAKDGYEIALFPYGEYKGYENEGERFEMAVILPEAGTTVGQALSWIAHTGNDLIASMNRDDATLMYVQLPCFRIESSLENLQDILSREYPLPFTAEADFSGISDDPLFISKVLQKTYISSDEKGTEASSATVSYMVTAGGDPLPDPVIFKADHPFVFLIREKATGSNIFLGVKQ